MKAPALKVSLVKVSGSYPLNVSLARVEIESRHPQLLEQTLEACLQHFGRRAFVAGLKAVGVSPKR